MNGPYIPENIFFAGENRRILKTACNMPKAVGNCKAVRHRYFFNTETKACEHFVYSGCQGNNNNFVSKQDCAQLCEPEQEIGLLGRGRTGIPPENSNTIFRMCHIN